MEKTFLVLLGISFLLFSCRLGFYERSQTLRANYHYSRGNYQAAMYFHQDLQRQFDDPSLKPWFSYNLGLVFAALGNSQDAMDLWDKALRQTQNPFLLSRLEYNRGVVLFYRGFLVDAFGAFKRSLSFDPHYLDARINLELSLAALETAQNSSNEAGSISSRKGNTERDVEDNAQRLLIAQRLKERVEEGVWKSRLSTLSPPMENDY